MSEQRKLAHERLLDFIKQPAKDFLSAVPEAENVIVAVPWAMGLNYPPGTIITRGQGLNILELFAAKQQLMRMITNIDQMVLTLLEQKGPANDAGKEPVRSAATQEH